MLRVQGEDVTNAKQLAELAEAGGRMWRIRFNRGGRINNVMLGG